MIITMSVSAERKDIQNVKSKVEELGYATKLFQGERKTVIHVIGVTEREKLMKAVESMPGVENLVPILRPFKMASREFHPENTVISINGKKIGNKEIVVIAGPCAVESEENYLEIAELVKAAGANFLRGGAFKPRSSPYSFQGLGEKGLEIMAKAREKTGLGIVTEVVSEVDVPLVFKYADVFQIGARNMHNFHLLKTVGRFNKPVMLKRGMSATIEEWLMSAEYILSEGNPNVFLCERGIRTFERYTRNTLDISAVPVIDNLSHLPVIVDPSHASGDSKYVCALAKAAIAAGADGLMVEVHIDPSRALSDGKQSLKPDVFMELMQDLKKVAQAVGRTL
ncbi:3-deoxy-7-phosphoheptulonate synthase [candidate division WOR-3 bacterium RBG_13_43_14]|uniref:3-deoxy-7-phosphoheptulonate synthase n=1 Tax=candidate division WOR-3 bacterium RBG_13_43_14 TaxID=1802590 RepID=A0A1F4U237_UNCW3|nr:MAG: 3-deoxy-7-phosphoheptulonate synthase [candidate division WOR-3 bacterium RBG_13_43_14]